MISRKAEDLNDERVKLYIEDQKKPKGKRKNYEDPPGPNLIEAFHQIMHEGKIPEALGVMSANLDLIREVDEASSDVGALWGAEGAAAKETLDLFGEVLQSSYQEKFGTEKVDYSSDMKVLAKVKAAADSPKIYQLLKEMGDWRNKTLRSNLHPWLMKIKAKHPEWMRDFPTSIAGSL